MLETSDDTYWQYTYLFIFHIVPYLIAMDTFESNVIMQGILQKILILGHLRTFTTQFHFAFVKSRRPFSENPNREKSNDTRKIPWSRHAATERRSQFRNRKRAKTKRIRIRRGFDVMF